MSLLKQLLDEIKLQSEDQTEQLQILCDRIYEDEKSSIQYPELLPKGGMTLLSLEVLGRNDKEVGFLSLEREDVETFVIVYYTLEKDRLVSDVTPRRRKTWIIKEFKPEKVITAFLQKVKMLKKDN